MPRQSSQKQGKSTRPAARNKRSILEASLDSSSSSSDDEQERAPRKRGRKAASSQPLEKWGDYILKFQDDKTGNRNIHPTALRFTLGIVEEAAEDTTASVAKSLKEDGEMEESRKVQVGAKRHVMSVVAQVRQRLRESKIPTRYVKIEDLNLNDLSGINRQRRDEIAANKRLAKKLEQQLEVLKKESSDAKAKRDEAQAKLSAKIREEKDGGAVAIHPLLQAVAEPETLRDTRGDDEEKCSQTLTDWLKSIPSPYDEYSGMTGDDTSR